MSSTNTMTAWAVAEHDKPLQKITLPIPEPTGTEILVKVTHCGVCHSDLHFWEGLGGGKKFHLAERGVQLPRAVGHEIFGTVAKLGPSASALDIGSPRIVYPWVGCGSCRRCQQGDDNLCSAQKSLGVLTDGGFAEYVLVPHARYLVDAGDVDPAIACTFGCSGITVLSSIRKILPLEPEDPVVLIGAGGLGLSAIAMLRALGHRKIISLDIAEEKLAAAKAAGATATVNSGGETGEVVKKVLEAAGGPVLGVIDFVNGSKTASLGYTVVAKGGKMVGVGVMGGELSLSLVGMIFKAVTMFGNNTGSPAHLREVAQLAREGKLAPIPITVVPRDEAFDALMKLRDGKVTGRIVLKY